MDDHAGCGFTTHDQVRREGTVFPFEFALSFNVYVGSSEGRRTR